MQLKVFDSKRTNEIIFALEEGYESKSVSLAVVDDSGKHLFYLLHIEKFNTDEIMLVLADNIPKKLGFKTNNEGKLIPEKRLLE